MPYDYFRDAPDDTVGLAKTANLIKAAQAEAKNSLLFDNGDFLQGSSLGDFVAYKKGLKAGETHPMIAAMNALPYQCGTLGNHEFNYGLDFLEHGIARAEFPIVCANVERVGGGTLIEPWRIFEQSFEDEAGAKHVLNIAVIGFVPPQIMQWDKANLERRVTATDIVEAAQKYLPEIALAHPDLTIALCHSGIAGGERRAARRTPRFTSPGSTASTSSSPATSTWSSPAARPSTAFPASTTRRARCTASRPASPASGARMSASSISSWRSATGAGASPTSRSIPSRSSSARRTARSCRRRKPKRPCSRR